MECAACHHRNDVEDRFCSECGAPLPTACTACGAGLKAGAKFCSRCGARAEAHVTDAGSAARTAPPAAAPGLSNKAASTDGERKTVTVLFADIKGSMELIEGLDPEDARAIVDPALKLMMEAVHHYDGFVAQSTGDGIFALFGAPVASEDHPQRALYAALRMQNALQRYSDDLRAEGHLPIQVRIGINTGEMVVRALQTGDSRADYTPVGHATSLAARMQALAPIGSIATTATVKRLCDGYFAFRAMGPARVKGVSEPVDVFEVSGLGTLRTRLQRSAGRGLTRFIGREEEMAVLRRCAELARHERGQIVALVAEAGVGKSRLCYEFAAAARSEWLVLETFSAAHSSEAAFLPLLNLLHAYFEIDGDDDRRRRREKVAGKIGVLDRALDDTVPRIFKLLGLAEDSEPLADDPKDPDTRAILDAVKRILLRESLNQPLIVMFEDLHWTDPQTQAFLDLLADSIGTARILLLVNYRPEYTHGWVSRTFYSQLRLDPLGRESAATMLALLLGDNDELTDLKRLIIEQTEGNPFFIEEMVHTLFDEGTLVDDGRVQLARPLREIAVPPTVQAILATRIDRLPADAKALLQLLAVIGREIPLSLVRTLTAKPDDELEPLLKTLQLGEFVYELPAISEQRYVFKHALTQEVAYHSVLVAQRKQLHEQVGRALEALHGDDIDSYLVELAYHYGRSGDVDTGVKYTSDAAKQKLDEAHQRGDEISTQLGTGGSPSGALQDRAAGRASAASVAGLWRYPVKSMAGEEVLSSAVTQTGVLGDRAYALVDQASNRAAALRTWATELLSCRPRFTVEPVPGQPLPEIAIELPNGVTLTTSDPDLDRRFSALLGHELALMATKPAGLLLEFPAGTLGGAFSTATEYEFGAETAPGAFFDIGCVHLIANSTLDSLRQAYPDGNFDVRRFRPNVLVDMQGEPFAENAWVGRTLALGDEVTLHVTMPCPRCSTVTLAQPSLPRDPRILRVIAELNAIEIGEFGVLPCVGVYADVTRAGTVRKGDVVRVLD